MCFRTSGNSQLGIEIPNGYFIMCFRTSGNSQLGIEIPNGYFIMCFRTSGNSQLGTEIPNDFFILCFVHLGIPNWDLRFPMATSYCVRKREMERDRAREGHPV